MERWLSWLVEVGAVHANRPIAEMWEGLGKSMVVFRLFEKLRYSNKEENGKMVALQILPKIESLYESGRQATN